jgi:crotonobetainyl-CoA:carnitine CoA-transferase CaiB-like acyl-CoA transferase
VDGERSKGEEQFMKAGPLAGLSVLELGRMVAAPYCAKWLADLGADVVKIEEPGAGDPARHRGAFPDDVPHPERSGLFLYLNTSKLGVTLNLKTAAGRRIFRELAAGVDVLIEDYPPGALEGMGLGYEELSSANPGLIVTSVTPFGQTGPYRSYRTHHLNLYHASGHSSFFYMPEGDERPPARAGGYLGEYDGGLTAALGTLGALLQRTASGRGQHLDVSKQEAMMCLERVDIGRMTNDPDPKPWRGSVGGVLKVKDGYLVVTPVQDHQWNGFMRALGNPEWSTSELCKDEIARTENRDKLQPLVEECVSGMNRDELYHRAQAEGTPIGPVRNVAEVQAWKQARQRGFFQEVEHPEAGTYEYAGSACQFSESPWALGPAPLLGQHNEEIYCERLGYERPELARLAAAGVI